jgi:hypothetical protein
MFLFFSAVFCARVGEILDPGLGLHCYALCSILGFAFLSINGRGDWEDWICHQSSSNFDGLLILNPYLSLL